MSIRLPVRRAAPWPARLLRTFALLAVLAVPAARPAAAWDVAWENLGRDSAVPPLMAEPRAVADPARRRMLVVGAREYGNLEVWAMTLDGEPKWSRLATSGPVLPSIRGFSLILDPGHDRLVMFGGIDAAAATSTLWQLTLSGDMRWSELAALGPRPSARAWHSAILDPPRNRMIVFGGRGADAASPVFSDVWALTLGDTCGWADVTPDGPSPNDRFAHVAVYDPARDRMLIHGGMASSLGPAYSDTWSLPLAGGGWELAVDASSLPPARYGHTAICDPAGDRVVMFGGGTNELWILPLASRAWQRQPRDAGVLPRRWHAAILDSASARMIVFAGQETPLECWALALDASLAWTKLAPPLAPRVPAGRYDHAAVTDTRRNRLLFVGGGETYFDGAPLWACSDALSGMWAPLHVTWADVFGVPGGSNRHMAVYDSLEDAVLVVDGESLPWLLTFRFTGPDEVWGSWWPADLLQHGPGPMRRSFATLVLDAPRRRLLMFGGIITTMLMQQFPSSEIWSFALDDTTGWKWILPEGRGPAPRGLHAAAIDPLRRRMIVTGGRQPGAPPLADTWALSLDGEPVWTPIMADGTPPPGLECQAMLYDPAEDRMLVFSGSESGIATWELTLGGAPAWHLLRSETATPGRRSRFAAGFEPWTRMLVLNGGWAGTALEDTWRLRLDTAMPRVCPSVSVVSLPHNVRLRWSVGARAGSRMTIERAGASGPWSALGVATSAADLSLSFTDDAAAPAAHYRYRLVPAGSGTAIEGSVVSVDVPDRSELSLYAVHPNPTPGALDLELLLPAGARVRIEAFDVSGRRAADETIVPAAPGRQHVALPRPLDARPGLYLLRITQGSSVTTGRVTVIR